MRTSFRSAIVAALALIGLAASAAAGTASAVVSKPFPNIVFILADDLGYGDVGCYFEFDAIVGRLLDKLQQLGVADNTLVILSSDNGPEIDDRDGMEASIGGSGYRATINSYQFGDALAIAHIAELAGKADIARDYREKAAAIKQLVQAQLWDTDAQFFKVLPRGENKPLANTREQHGFTPWYFNLPGPQFVVAWKQVIDPQGFYAPFGPTTADQRHPQFTLAYAGHECQWNGPSWPYATAITLTGLANLLNGPPQDASGAKDYFKLLNIYTQSHQLKLDDGRVVPWIDDNLNPANGDWISRTRLKAWKNGTWDAGKGGEERGKDYNHSTYCDLVISGLFGLRPRPDETVEVKPLVPLAWDAFCLDRIPYHGHSLTLLWDKTGQRYGKGRGLRVFADGKEIALAPVMTCCM